MGVTFEIAQPQETKLKRIPKGDESLGVLLIWSLGVRCTT